MKRKSIEEMTSKELYEEFGEVLQAVYDFEDGLVTASRIAEVVRAYADRQNEEDRKFYVSELEYNRGRIKKLQEQINSLKPIPMSEMTNDFRKLEKLFLWPRYNKYPIVGCYSDFNKWSDGRLCGYEDQHFTHFMLIPEVEK